jgi:hypothetical protein
MEETNQIPNTQQIQPIQTPEPVKNKNIFKILFIISLIVILGIIIAFYFVLNNKINQLSNKQASDITSIPTQNTTATKIIPTAIPTAEKIIIDPRQILNQLQTTLKTSSPISIRNNMEWLDDNGQYLLLTGQDFGLAGTVSNNYVGKYGNYSDVSSITIDSFKTLQSDIDKFFKSNGFEENKNNNKHIVNNSEDSLSTISMGYTKGEVKCLIRLYAKTDPFADIFCGIIDEKRTAWLKELSPVINSTNDPNISVSVDKMIGNYAQGGAGGRYGGGGAAWMAQKINGVWTKIWGGQDTISCSIVNQYQIPKEIYGTCQ